ncbi:MAG: DNA-binding protein Alba [Candidatus Bathyarchaeia archaeon]
MATSGGNLVRVGRKPLINYVVACVTLFNSGLDEVTVRARGRTIPKAVDTVGMLKRAFLKELIVKSVDIGSEDIRQHNGKEKSISTIEITLSKKPGD